MHYFTAGCFKQDTKIKGKDVDECRNRKLDSPEECQKLCKNVTECMAFTYVGDLAQGNDAYRKSCCFKSALPTKENTMVSEHRVTGPKFCGKYLSVFRSLKISCEHFFS